MFKLKRAYDPVSPDDGARILVDRLWPRGVRKVDAHLDRWAKELAPSSELCKWFSHDPAKWQEFQERYRKELASQEAAVEELAAGAKDGAVTLIYAARDQEHNNALVLRDVLENR